MSVMKKMKGASSTLPAGIGAGVLTALFATFCGAALAAYLISGEHLPQGSLNAFASGILIVSVALGAWVAAAQTKRLRLQVCLITAAAYYLTLLAMTALFFGGQYSGMGMAALMILLGAGAVALLGIPRKKGSKGKAIKRVYR